MMDIARPHHRSNHPGFTLIELLVVISVVAILMSLLLPSLSKARFNALILLCQNNERSLHIAMHNYGNDFKGQYPLSDQTYNTSPYMWPSNVTPDINYYSFSTTPGYVEPWAYGWYGPPPALMGAGYVDNYKVFYCPGTGGLAQFGWPAGAWGPSYASYYATIHNAYYYDNFRSVDLWAGNAWTEDMINTNNGYLGTVLFRCLTTAYETDPRDWTHENFVNEIRNDGSSRTRQVPVLGISVNPGNPYAVAVQFPAGYSYSDAWYQGQQ